MKSQVGHAPAIIPIAAITIELYRTNLREEPTTDTLFKTQIVPPGSVWHLADSFIALALQIWRPHLPTEERRDYRLYVLWEWEEDDAVSEWEITLLNNAEQACVFNWEPGRLARQLQESHEEMMDYDKAEVDDLDYYCHSPEACGTFLLTHEIGS